MARLLVLRLLVALCSACCAGATAFWSGCLAPADNTNPAVRAAPTTGRLQRMAGLNTEKRRCTQNNQVDDQSAGPRGLDARSAPEGLTRCLCCVYAAERRLRVLRDSPLRLTLSPSSLRSHGLSPWPSHLSEQLMLLFVADQAGRAKPKASRTRSSVALATVSAFSRPVLST